MPGTIYVLASPCSSVMAKRAADNACCEGHRCPPAAVSLSLHKRSHRERLLSLVTRTRLISAPHFPPARIARLLAGFWLRHVAGASCCERPPRCPAALPVRQLQPHTKEIRWHHRCPSHNAAHGHPATGWLAPPVCHGMHGHQAASQEPHAPLFKQCQSHAHGRLINHAIAKACITCRNSASLEVPKSQLAQRNPL